MGLILFGIFWIVCGVLTYGFWLGYFMTKFGDVTDPKTERIIGALFALLGPFSLTSMIINRFYRCGLRFW